MGVRSRTITLVAIMSIALTVVVVVAAGAFALRGSDDNDSREALAALRSSSAVISSDLQTLASVANDWAVWDDTYDYIKDRNARYVRTNLGMGTLNGLDVDFMLFFDAQGRLVHGDTRDPATRSAATLSNALSRYFASQPAMLHSRNPLQVFSGGLGLTDGPYLITAQPIGRSNRVTPPDGTFVVGYRLGEDALSELEAITRHSIDAYPDLPGDMPTDVSSVRSLLTSDAPETTRVADDASVAAYGLVPGVDGAPGLVLRVRVPRTAHAEAVALLGRAGLAVAILEIVIFGVFWVTLDNTVLKRLTALGAAVKHVTDSADTKLRVLASGSDEITGLATEINGMLTAIDRSSSEMSHLVEHDPLTGLYNRRHFETELRREIDEYERLGGTGAILWIDLDHFKDINDSLGHAAGDELLRALGQYLSDETRAYCTMARLGGDEFGMLIPQTGGPEALAVAARLLQGLSSRTFLVSERELRISASVGVVCYPDQGTSTSELLARADIAMYQAKAKGGNQAIAWKADDAWTRHMAERLEVSERILAAIRENRLLLYAQPIFGAAKGGPERYELLLRMRALDGSLIPPSEIIPTAERVGLIRDIDRWVVRRAIRLLALAHEQGRDVDFWVNVSGRAFDDEELLEIVESELRSTGAAPERLVFEITETSAIADVERADRFIGAIKRFGCRFAVDDFGSGAASFHYLKHLAVDFLKIDGSLVRGIGTDPADTHFVRAIIEMCRGLNIQSVAEWIETPRILEQISLTEVDFMQGFHLGMPEPLDFYLGPRFAESEHPGA